MNYVHLIGIVKSWVIHQIDETRKVVMFTLIVEDGWTNPERFVEVPCESWGKNKASYFEEAIHTNDRIGITGKIKKDKLGNIVIAAHEVNLVARACDLKGNK